MTQGSYCPMTICKIVIHMLVLSQFGAKSITLKLGTHNMITIMVMKNGAFWFGSHCVQKSQME